MVVGDLGLIDSHKLSAELGNFTRPLREDTEERRREKVICMQTVTWVICNTICNIGSQCDFAV